MPLPAESARSAAAPRFRYSVLLRPERLTAVTDACSMASSAGHVARHGTASIIAVLAWRGRPNVFISENVEGELPKAMRLVAENMGVPLAEVERVMTGQILPRIRVVPLRVGDHLHPAIAAVRNCDPALPAGMRGDPDDLGTAAVAHFLAPAVIISKDSVFNRFGLALPAAQWTEEAQRLLAAAGYEADLQAAAGTAGLAARSIYDLRCHRGDQQGRSPAPEGRAGRPGGRGHRRGWLTADSMRQAGNAIASGGKHLIDAMAAATERQAHALNALTVVRRHTPITLEQRCARQLAMHHAAMTPNELRDALSTPGMPVTAAAIRRAVQVHPAFTRQPGDRYTLGRPASVPAVGRVGGASTVTGTAPLHVILPPASAVHRRHVKNERRA